MDKFQALYIINKSTKKYASLGENRDMQRADALYRVKHKLIKEWVDEFDSIHLHNIDDDEFFYFIKGEYGFHVPKNKFDSVNISISKTKKIEDFHSSAVNESVRNEREALQYIRSEFGLNVNSYLPADHDPNAEWGLIY